MTDSEGSAPYQQWRYCTLAAVFQRAVLNVHRRGMDHADAFADAVGSYGVELTRNARADLETIIKQETERLQDPDATLSTLREYFQTGDFDPLESHVTFDVLKGECADCGTEVFVHDYGYRTECRYCGSEDCHVMDSRQYGGGLIPDGGTPLTKDCPDCMGAGEFVVLEQDGRERAVTGVKAMNLMDDGWTHKGVTECSNCSGYGHVDARTGEI